MGFERGDAVGRGAGKANGDFVEVMAVRVNEFDAGDALQRVDDRVECSGVSNREGAHAFGAEQRHVHRAHERDEGLVGAEVRGRAVTRMCCSRVDRVRQYAVCSSSSIVRPTMRPGI